MFESAYRGMSFSGHEGCCSPNQMPSLCPSGLMPSLCSSEPTPNLCPSKSRPGRSPQGPVPSLYLSRRPHHREKPEAKSVYRGMGMLSMKENLTHRSPFRRVAGPDAQRLARGASTPQTRCSSEPSVGSLRTQVRNAAASDGDTGIGVILPTVMNVRGFSVHSLSYEQYQTCFFFMIT